MDFGKYIGGREDVMLDKRKIRLMTRAAIYEKNYGEEDFKISSYYKKDYSSLNTWVTLIWITVGYGLAVAVMFLGWGEAAMEGITLAKLFVFAAVAIGAYVSLLIAYGIGAGSFYKNKHIMSTLLVWREKLQRIYALYSIYIQKGLQFVTGLVLFWVINSNIGFMKPASSVFCTLGLAVICTFLPMTITVLAATALILAHCYALSLPIALVALVIFILMYIFYFRFTPKKAWLVLISGLAFSLKIPFVIPIAFGLLGSPVWIVPASCGIITYYMTDYVKVSAAALKEADASGIAANLMSFTKQVLASKEMWLMVMAVTIGILVVNFVRTRGVDHSWKIASAAGAAVTVVVSAAGNIVLSTNISYIEIILSAVLGAVTGLVLELLFFSVDYSRTENIQFEDDEYYYYVKAVPKVGVAVPEKKVKRITENQPQETTVIREDADLNNINTENDADDILLTRSLSKELGLEKQRPE